MISRTQQNSNRLLARLPGAVLWKDLQAGDEHHVHNLISAVGLVNKHFAARRIESDKVFMFGRNAPPVSHMNKERSKWARMQKRSHFVHLQSPCSIDWFFLRSNRSA